MSQQQEQTAAPNVNGLSVWFEIPVTDLDRSQAFYEAVLGIKMLPTSDPSAPNPMVWFNDPASPVTSGHLYPGKPAAAGTGNTIHMLATDPLETVMERVGSAGGSVVSPVIDIPAGRFVYILDPDGNSIGFFNWKH